MEINSRTGHKTSANHYYYEGAEPFVWLRGLSLKFEKEMRSQNVVDRVLTLAGLAGDASSSSGRIYLHLSFSQPFAVCIALALASIIFIIIIASVAVVLKFKFI